MPRSPDTFIKDSVCNACYQLMSTPQIVEFLSQLAKDAAFCQKVAYARLYYLKETKMLEQFRS